MNNSCKAKEKRMNAIIDTLAEELGRKIREIVDLPFYTEEEEELFFRLVVAKLAEISLGRLMAALSPDLE